MFFNIYKKIEKAILAASSSNTDCLVEYSDIEQFRSVIRRDYLNKVAYGTLELIAKPKTPQYDEIKKEIGKAIRKHPEGLVAGNVFSVCYKGITGSAVPEKFDIYLLNSKQSAIIKKHMRPLQDKEQYSADICK